MARRTLAKRRCIGVESSSSSVAIAVGDGGGEAVIREVFEE